MKNNKRIWAILLIATMLMGNGILANAAETENDEKNILNETVSNLKNGYSEYYEISNTETTLCSSDEVDGNVENIYLLEMDAVLKADSVEKWTIIRALQSFAKQKQKNLVKCERKIVNYV